MNIIQTDTLPQVGDQIYHLGRTYKVINMMRTIKHLVDGNLHKAQIASKTDNGVGVILNVYFKII